MLFTIDTSLITLLIPIYKSRLGFGDTVVTLFLVCYMAAVVGLTAALTLLTAAAAAASAWTVSIGLRVVAELPSVEAILGE
jgi:hypothetical protein